MLKIKGLYEWKLINAKTGKIDKQGRQENLVSDWMMAKLCAYSRLDLYEPYSVSNSKWKIQLSNSTTTPGTDYRKAGEAAVFSKLEESPEQDDNVDYQNLSTSFQYNFSPPGALRTITIIGANTRDPSAGYGSGTDFMTFIELSTSISQDTDQFLFIKYTMFFNWSIGGDNTPNNRFFEWGMLSPGLMRGLPNIFGSIWDSNPYVKSNITRYRSPSNLDKLMRYPSAISSNDDNALSYSSTVEYAVDMERSFGVTELVGPVGISVFAENRDNDIDPNINPNAYWFRSIYGYSPDPDQGASISRVFTHPPTRLDQIFSDPSYPPSSRGGITLSGTPTNLSHIIGRIKITKTGDASDISNTTNNTFTVSSTPTTQLDVNQDWNDSTHSSYRSVARVESTGALPSPLSPGTDYYVIYVDSNTIELSDTETGSAISLTTTGSGTHTIIRESTGRFRLELEPYNYNHRLEQLPMGIDKDNKVMPHDLRSSHDPGEGGNPRLNNNDGVQEYMIRGRAKVGDYLYSFQKSRHSEVHNVCRWPWYSIETSEAMVKFGNTNTEIRRVIAVSTDIYIATNDGIYKYDTTSPAVVPSLLSISGIIDSDITDMAYDSDTGYMWSAHANAGTPGMSRIDLSGPTAIQYIAGAGQKLDGMNVEQAKIYAGQLEAYAGRVLKTYPGRTVPSGTDSEHPWVFDDDANAYWFEFTTNKVTGVIRKGTNQIVYLNNDSKHFRADTITTTGKDAGTISNIDDVDASSDEPDQTLLPMVQLSDEKYMVLAAENYVGFDNNLYTYTIGSGYEREDGGNISGLNWFNYVDAVPQGSIYKTWGPSQPKEPIDINGSGLFLNMLGPSIINPYFPTPIPYGWDGSSWEKDNSGDRRIPRTGTLSLLDGLSVAFNNATGEDWSDQFVEDERFTFVYGPTKIKDNLQEMSIKAKYYYCEAHIVESLNINIPGSPHEYTITEAANPDFRDMDTDEFVTSVFEGATEYTQVASSPGPQEYSVSNDGVFTFNSADTGKSVDITYTYTFYN